VANINLLPWREAQRSRQQTRFNMLAVLALIAGCICVLFLSLILNNVLVLQEEQQQFLNVEMTTVDDRTAAIKTLKSEKEALNKRIESIVMLQNIRNVSTHLLDALAKITSQGVYLESVKRTDDTLWIEGVAQSNRDLTNMLRNFENYKWFERVVVKKIESQNNDIDSTKPNKFSLRVDISNLIE